MTIEVAPAVGNPTAPATQEPPAPPIGHDVRYDDAAEMIQGPAPADRAQFVYAIGRIEARFSTLGVEKEFSQATGRTDSAGLTDRETAHAVLSDPANRYLARRLCWVLTIEGIDTYVLIPRDSTDLDLLIDAIRPVPSPLDVDVVIGTLGPLAGPDVCNGLVAPMVAFDQIYSFDSESFLSAIPRPEKLAAKEFRAASEEVFTRIGQIADNSGATDEHRALNYLTVRYPAIYSRAAEQFASSSSLTAVEVLPSRLSGVRRLVNAVFTYTDRSSGVQDKYAVKVDVTEEFPFLVGALSPYYDR
jgi:PatG Domain